MKVPKARRIIEPHLNSIFTKWKKSARELSGWILDDSLIWLDYRNCKKDSVEIDYGTSKKMADIGALSFHTHPYLDPNGKISISPEDMAYSYVTGADIIFTSGGIFLLTPRFQIDYTYSEIEENLEKIYNSNIKYVEDLIKETKRYFKCRINRLF
jgi:hypothetical protein